MNKKVLGRGLEALISEPQEAESRNHIAQIDVDKIKPNRYQPREDFDKDKLNELILSIKEKGIVQPILLRPSGDGYELIAGERRLKAIKSLGRRRIPAVVKDVDDLNAIELSLIENIQRQELNPLEEAHAYQRLIDEFNFTQEMVGQAVGKDRATISNSLRLLTLPEEIQNFITENLLSVGHAKTLLSIDDKKSQMNLARAAVKRGLSVRMLENIVRRNSTTGRKKTQIDNDMRMIEEKIQQKLGTKVKIARGKKCGTIQIEYYSDTDLNRILKILGCI